MALGVVTVNLGGNEPIFTNGLDTRHTLLPYIIRTLSEQGIAVGLTTSGITLHIVDRDHNDALMLLNDVDISLDSPFAEEHNHNRGAQLYKMAIEALQLCKNYNIDHSIIMCAMKWNFTERHIDALLELARQHEANVRINVLRPVEQKHKTLILSGDQFYRGFSRLIASTDQIDLSDPLLSAITAKPGKGCPCGRTSFRIHSITPDGRLPVSPCIYLHDYKAGDLLTDEVRDIVSSPQFKAFRQRNAQPAQIPGCADCSLLNNCRGGCAARAFLHHLLDTGIRTIAVKDPYCIRDHIDHCAGTFPRFPSVQLSNVGETLVHKDYLCTWIGVPSKKFQGNGDRLILDRDGAVESHLGALVDVQIDRPIGSSHPRHGYTYPVNYGFVPGIKVGDGQDLDVYLLGVVEPLTRFRGRCIAVIRRYDDLEDKLIVVPDGRVVSDNEIRRITDFQEKYFQTAILRTFDRMPTHVGESAVPLS